MFYLLLFFSLMTLGAGVFLIGFGVPLRETAFGSSLLISGTIAVVGCFLLVGLAGAIQELRRVVHGLRRIPVGPRPQRPVDRKEAERRPPPQRAVLPGRPAPDAPILAPSSLDEPPFEVASDVRSDVGARADGGNWAEPHARPEPHARADTGARPDQRTPARNPGPAWLRRAIAEIESVPPAGEAPAPAPFEPTEARHPDPRHYDEPAPVRRHAPNEGGFGRPEPAAGERPTAPESWMRLRGPAAPAAPAAPEDYAPEPEVRMRPRIPVGPATPVAPAAPAAPAAPIAPAENYPPESGLPPPRQPSAPPPNIFDMVWASERRRPASASAPAPEPWPEPQSHPPIRSAETRPVPPVPMPAPAAPVAAPVAAAPPAPPPRPEPPRPEPLRAEPPRPEPPRPEPPRPLSVLKSGVIDEMAYTLFTDGSIEAQMPDGIMRFSSIEELRRHLDQNEG